ncbi:MAG: hypothetical protein EP298_01550 [Gammaproteobacteria bacterium]|nr:MAG: hypothetical protein EP298_01550 [Gammaproteobacteria bacterium]UTW43891.1 hypothetical protein KFE69_07325 [bacterium SCSIO 12844]
MPTQKKKIYVEMGEFKMAQLDKAQLETDELSSCYVLCLYNEKNGIGGLFHVPSFPVNLKSMPRTTRSEAQAWLIQQIPTETMLQMQQMFKEVNPTKIRFVDGGYANQDSMFLGDDELKLSLKGQRAATNAFLQTLWSPSKGNYQENILVVGSSNMAVMTHNKNGDLLVSATPINEYDSQFAESPDTSTKSPLLPNFKENQQQTKSNTGSCCQLL